MRSFSWLLVRYALLSQLTPTLRWITTTALLARTRIKPQSMGRRPALKSSQQQHGVIGLIVVYLNLLHPYPSLICLKETGLKLSTYYSESLSWIKITASLLNLLRNYSIIVCILHSTMLNPLIPIQILYPWSFRHSLLFTTTNHRQLLVSSRQLKMIQLLCRVTRALCLHWCTLMQVEEFWKKHVL